MTLRPLSLAAFTAASLLVASNAAAQDQPAPPPAPPPPAGETPPPPAEPPPSTTTTGPSAETTTSTETSTSVDSTALARKDWYGGQIIIADVVGYGVMALGAGIGAGDNDVGTNAIGIAAPGVTAYAFGGPFIHALHDNTDAGAKSLLTRLLLPAGVGGVGALIGLAATGQDEKGPVRMSSGMFWGGIIGVGAGALAASVIDAMFWARKETKANEGAPPPPAGMRVVPTVSAAPSGGMAGLGGVF